MLPYLALLFVFSLPLLALILLFPEWAGWHSALKVLKEIQQALFHH